MSRTPAAVWLALQEEEQRAVLRLVWRDPGRMVDLLILRERMAPPGTPRVCVQADATGILDESPELARGAARVPLLLLRKAAAPVPMPAAAPVPVAGPALQPGRTYVHSYLRRRADGRMAVVRPYNRFLVAGGVTPPGMPPPPAAPGPPVPGQPAPVPAAPPAPPPAPAGGEPVPPGLEPGQAGPRGLGQPLHDALAGYSDQQAQAASGYWGDQLHRHYPGLAQAPTRPEHFDPALGRARSAPERADAAIWHLVTDGLTPEHRHDARLAALLHVLGQGRSGHDPLAALHAAHMVGPLLEHLPITSERKERLRRVLMLQGSLGEHMRGERTAPATARLLGDHATLDHAARVGQAVLAATPGLAGFVGQHQAAHARVRAALDRQLQHGEATSEGGGSPDVAAAVYDAPGARLPSHAASWFAGQPPAQHPALVETAAAHLAADDHAWQNYAAGVRLPNGLTGEPVRREAHALQAKTLHADPARRYREAQDAIQGALSALHLLHKEDDPLAVALADIARSMSNQPLGPSWLPASAATRAKAAPIVEQHAEWLAHVLLALGAVTATQPSAGTEALEAGLRARTGRPVGKTKPPTAGRPPGGA